MEEPKMTDELKGFIDSIADAIDRGRLTEATALQAVDDISRTHFMFENAMRDFTSEEEKEAKARVLLHLRKATPTSSIEDTKTRGLVESLAGLAKRLWPESGVRHHGV